VINDTELQSLSKVEFIMATNKNIERESVELGRTLGRICVGEGMDVGKAIEAVTSAVVMMVIHIPGVAVHDAKN